MYNGRLRKCFQTLGFNTRTHGNSLSPRNESRDRLGNTDIDSGGIHKQVARVCEWMQKGFWWRQVDSSNPSVWSERRAVFQAFRFVSSFALKCQNDNLICLWLSDCIHFRVRPNCRCQKLWRWFSNLRNSSDSSASTAARARESEMRGRWVRCNV